MQQIGDYLIYQNSNHEFEVTSLIEDWTDQGPSEQAIALKIATRERARLAAAATPLSLAPKTG